MFMYQIKLIILSMFDNVIQQDSLKFYPFLDFDTLLLSCDFSDIFDIGGDNDICN